SDSERDPRGWLMTIALLVYLPSQAFVVVKPGPDGREPIVIDVDFKTSQCCFEGQVLTAEDFAFDHYEIVLTSIQRIQGRL
ncbi:DNA mismatch repair protein MutT, partial [Streptococcus suis]